MATYEEEERVLAQLARMSGITSQLPGAHIERATAEEQAVLEALLEASRGPLFDAMAKAVAGGTVYHGTVALFIVNLNLWLVDLWTRGQPVDAYVALARLASTSFQAAAIDECSQRLKAEANE